MACRRWYLADEFNDESAAQANGRSSRSVETNGIDGHRCLWLTVLTAIGRPGGRYLVEGGQPLLVDGAENGVVRRQLRILVDQEELTSVRSRTGIRHGQHASGVGDRLVQRWTARIVLVGGVLVVELIAGSSR